MTEPTQTFPIRRFLKGRMEDTQDILVVEEPMENPSALRAFSSVDAPAGVGKGFGRGVSEHRGHRSEPFRGHRHPFLRHRH
jgi:hypothetical protein